MQATDIRNPSERNKLILAGALGLVALLFLWWTFFGFGSSSKTGVQRPAGQSAPSTATRVPSKLAPPSAVDLSAQDDPPAPVFYHQPVSAPEAGRNIFAYYEPPPKIVKIPETPTPTPTPTPPVLLSNISPANVFAKTADFPLEISGDKITSQLRVVIDNSEVPTRYIGPQQLTATVPAALIANPGSRQVMLRSSDGKVYSNALTLSVAKAPKPNYSYIGIIGTPHHIDTAILQDKGTKDTLNVQRGDLLGGRFRVTSISEKEVVFTDTNLKIKHTLPFSVSGDKGNATQRPTPRVSSDDADP